MGRIIFSGVSLNMNYNIHYASNFSDNSWDNIINACHSNLVPSTWEIGDQKIMTIGDYEYIIDIIGKNHDEYADGSGFAPLTFQLHNCYGSPYQMNASDTNNGGWKECSMRNVHLPDILKLMPNSVQNGIRKVNKKTSAGNQSDTIIITSDLLFLLSELEIHGNTTYSFSGEGTQYEYYKQGGSPAKTLNGNGMDYWDRSPCNRNKTSFCTGLGFTGGTQTFGVATYSYYIPFAFCF